MKDKKNIQSFREFKENLNISDVSDSLIGKKVIWKGKEILNELEDLKSKYKGLSKSAVSDFEDNVSHFKYVGKVRGLNDAIEVVKKYCS
jgi:archaellum component FlaC